DDDRAPRGRERHGGPDAVARSSRGGERAMSDKPRVGVIGLGVMGSRMAGAPGRAREPRRVLCTARRKKEAPPAARPAAVTAAGAAAAASAGVVAAVSAGDVARNCNLVLSSLPWPATVREVYLGAGGVIENARPGTILVDTSTVDPETTRAVHAAAAARDV